MRIFSIFCLLLLLVNWSCKNAPASEAEQAQTTKYEPTNESLSAHPIPDWYNDAKLGIFVCWGLYSIPGWTKGTEKPLEEILAEGDGTEWFANNPYAEWYLNSLKIEGSATQTYHKENFGEDFTYYDFVPMFNEESQKWNPNEMAELFKQVGAGYVVLVTKFHDGFLLWPSETPNPKRADYVAKRNIVGELTDAVKARDMKMGFYYSSGLDWTFNDKTITNFPTLFEAIPQDTAYAKYIDTHWRELMSKYEPSILWADIGSPQAFDPNPLLADFYNKNPEGVVNDRHKMGMTANGFASPVHYDFTTPEYQVLDTISDKKWETVRGIGLSFGYNRAEDVAEFLSVDELVDMFIDIVSKNGNLLLNVGPQADGSISEGQKERLLGLGKWYQANREAIYGTRPWKMAQATGKGGERVRFTSKGDAVYLLALDKPADGQLQISGVPFDAVNKITAVDGGAEVPFHFENGVLAFSITGKDAPAYAFRID